MSLEKLGLTEELAKLITELDPGEFCAGRVVQEHRERYIVSDGSNEYDSEIIGNLRFSASSRADYPAVGDWVVIKTYSPEQAIIHRVLPRRNILSRQAVGKPGEQQIISANVDVAFIVQAVNNNFSVNRLERYLAICHSASIEPVLILSKSDLAAEEDIKNTLKSLELRDRKVRYILLSNLSLIGLDQVSSMIRKGKTYCVLGSSGVGKSTLINNLLEKNVIKTNEISSHTNKGRHTTEHRQLFILSNGGIIIDNPGMREIGLTDDREGINETFSDIYALSAECRYPDCSHRNEAGCAIRAAVERGDIKTESYNNYLRLLKEQEHFNTSASERKKRDRIFGKILKNYKKGKSEGKY
jgi:ribosome biogenesis GTPase / thiamine phosphate phosphatase